MKKCLFLLCVLAASVSCVENLNDNNDETIAELSLTETEVEFEDAEEASLKVLFVATHEWSAEVIKGDRWLSVETSSGDGSKDRQSVKISVSENTAKKSREGKIVFIMEGADDQTLVVTQAGAEDSSDDEGNADQDTDDKVNDDGNGDSEGGDNTGENDDPATGEGDSNEDGTQDDIVDPTVEVRKVKR